jgi:FixJ family two-component response regulator
MAKTPTRIAIVDDDASVRGALYRLLRASRFEAKAYSSGGEFVADCPSFRPHCAIVDLHMPGMSGLEAQQHLASKGLPVSVIIITGHDAPHARAECLAAGAIAYLTKPVDEQVLMSSIARIAQMKGAGIAKARERAVR